MYIAIGALVFVFAYLLIGQWVHGDGRRFAARPCPALRIFAQILLVLPITLLAPFSFRGTELGPALIRGGEFLAGVAYGSSWIGLVGLYASIFTPLRILRRPFGKRLIGACLIWGILVAIFFGIFCEPPGDSWSSELPPGPLFYWASAYVFGGPTIVACWNLLLMFLPGPDHKPTPSRLTEPIAPQ